MTDKNTSVEVNEVNEVDKTDVNANQLRAQTNYIKAAVKGITAQILYNIKKNIDTDFLKEAGRIGKFIGTGLLDHDETVNTYIDTILAALPAKKQNKFKSATSNGIKNGMENPFDVSKIGLNAKPKKALKLPRWDEDKDGAGPVFVNVQSDGVVPALSENLQILFDFYQVEVKYCVMNKITEIIIPQEINGGQGNSRNAKLATLRKLCRRHNIRVGEEYEDELLILSEINAYHPVGDWINSKEHDGVDHFELLFNTLVFQKDFDQYIDLYKDMLRAWLICGAKMALLPLFEERGTIQQGVLCLTGEGGIGKTEFFMSLVPKHGKKWAKSGMSIDPDKKDSVAQCTRTWITELGELGSTMKGDMDNLKRWTTADSDVHRKAYAKVEEEYARRTLVCGSVNQDTFLRDETGNRRWWVLPLERVKWKDNETNKIGDIDMQQLWRQMSDRALAGESESLGDKWKIQQKESVDLHRVVSPMEEEVRKLFTVDLNLPKDQWLTTKLIYQTIYPDREYSKWSDQEKKSVSAAFKVLGAKPTRTNKDGTVYPVIRKEGVVIVNAEIYRNFLSKNEDVLA